MTLCAQGSTNSGTRYAGKLVGISPELMPLDSNLFADLEYAIKQHCAITHDLAKGDRRKFSLMRPPARSACIVLAVLRKWVTHFVCPACKNVHICCSVLKTCKAQRVHACGRLSGSCAWVRVCEARLSFRLPPLRAGWHGVSCKRPDGHSFNGCGCALILP